MVKKPVASFCISDSLKQNYYDQGYWWGDDFWTSFAIVAEEYSDKVALIDDLQEISFSDLKTLSIKFAGALAAKGITAGDVVVIHGRHCVEAVATILGCAYAGVIPALLPAMFSVDQIAGIIEHTQSRLLVAVGEDKELHRAAEAASQEDITLLVRTPADDLDDVQVWQAFADTASVAPARQAMDADDLLLLIFSSGTTGAPKGVMHSSNTVRFSVESYAAMHAISSVDVELVITAFGFVGSSLLGFYLTLLKGCTSVLMHNWSADVAIAMIERYRATHFLLMPTHAIDILNSPALNQTDCSSAARAVVAGVAESYRLDAKQRLCHKPFPMYGMSESPAHITGDMADDWEQLRKTEGHPMPGTELLLCDEDGQPVATGEPGNILVRGPNRFLGYYKADDLNAASITPEGFFKTGDIGFINEQGFMTFVSRSKDIIRRGGVTITPEDIEVALRSHPDIADVAVIGLPDARLGEKACACLIPKNNAELTLEALTAYLQANGVAQYLWPESVEICSEFPRTPSLKVQKNRLKTEIIDKLGISA